MIDSLYFLQFACFIFMLINALILGITHLHIYPDYNNDIISAECGFSSRSYLYRIFKEKEGCSPTVWRAKIQ